MARKSRAVPKQSDTARDQAALILLRLWHADDKKRQELPWERALLIAAGLSDEDLATLASQGLVKPVANVGTRRKAGRNQGGLVLTAAGKAWLEQIRTAIGFAQKARPSPTKVRARKRDIPQYDDDLGELWGRDILIKRFQQAAPNQRLICRSFEEQHWPRTIRDPLSIVSGSNPKRRCHDAIHNMNRHHLVRMLHFWGTGDGRHIAWDWVQ